VVVSTNPSRQTTTDADGSFGFDKLVGRPYTLVARAPTGVGGPVTAKLTATSDPVVLKLRPGGTVKVTTLDKAGKAGADAPISGATVELRGLDAQTARPAATAPSSSRWSRRAATRSSPRRPASRRAGSSRRSAPGRSS
jgi:hypothetical protein